MINALSRFAFCEEIIEEDGRVGVGLSRRSPYRYRNRPDNRVHTVKQGDTLHALASAYFQTLPRSAGFWWAIADFQPEPITDPTLALEPGTKITIPSTDLLLNTILGERRRREH